LFTVVELFCISAFASSGFFVSDLIAEPVRSILSVYKLIIYFFINILFAALVHLRFIKHLYMFYKNVYSKCEN